MGLFDRKVKRKGRKGSSVADDAPKLGPVSAVLSESRSESGEGSHEEIVQRRFGPTQDEGKDMAKGLPPARRNKKKKQHVEVAEKEDIEIAEPPAPFETSETKELDSPELEIDPMAHIGSSTTITGDIVAEEDLEILGTVEGTVMLMNHRVSIGNGGTVKGQVHSGSVVVNGRIEGDVEATEVVEVCAGGFVGGNVKGPRVILHDGAIVIGGLDMSAALTDSADGKKRPIEVVKEQPSVQAKQPQKIHTSSEPTKPTLKRVEVLPPEKANRR